MRRWRASSARSKPNSSTSTTFPIATPRGAICSRISKAITIVGGSTPLSATSPRSRQTGNPHNPVSTFPGEGQVVAQQVVKPHRRRVRTKRFRVRRFTVEPLLQIVEWRDLAVADHQQLAVQRYGIRQRREHVRKCRADIVAGARIEPLLA